MSFLSDIWDTISGSKNIKRAGKAAQNAANQQIATSKNQLADATKLYNDQTGTLANTLERQRGDLTASSTNQQNALQGATNQQIAALRNANANQQGVLTDALTGQLGDIDAAKAEASGLYDPYVGYGTNALGLMEGGFGEDPVSSAAFLERFKNSPLYQAVYQPAMNEAIKGATNLYSAKGLPGNFVKELQDRAAGIGGRTALDYYGLLDKAIGVGQGGANSLSDILTRLGISKADARGANALQRASAYGNLGSLSSGAYGDYGSRSATAYGNTGRELAGSLGDYASNYLTSGNQLASARNQGYSNLIGGQGAVGDAKAAKYMGLANTAQGFWSGAADLGGKLIGLGTGIGANGAPNWQNALSFGWNTR